MFFNAEYKTRDGIPTFAVTSEYARMVPKDQILDSRYSNEVPNTGKVTIIRDNGLAGSSCSHKIYVNNIAIAVLESREKIVLYLPVGNHQFGAKPKGICGGEYSEAKRMVAKDKELFFRVGYIDQLGKGIGFAIIPVADNY